MTESHRNTMVGLFAVIGVILACWLMFLFGEMPAWWGGTEYEVSIRIDGLHGISEGTQVDLNGVPVGRVLRVEFVSGRPGNVEVVAGIKKQYNLPFGTRARLQPAGLAIGRGRVTLVPHEIIVEDSYLPQDGSAVIQGEMVSAFGDMIPASLFDSIDRAFAKVADLAVAMVPAAEGVGHLVEERPIAQVEMTSVDEEQLTANLSTVLERLDISLKSFNATFGDPAFRERVLAALENIQEVTGQGREIAAKVEKVADTLARDIPKITRQLSDGIDEVQTHTTQALQQLHPLLENLASATAHLNQASRMLVEGDGSAALFLKDPRFYESLTLSIERITDLVDSLRRLSKAWEANDNNIKIDPKGVF